ncbi:MAG: translation initiation factor IF-3 [Candidatus Yanofskybacteria bacterium RIFCSPHIGHO2_02_FULL_41_29]|uniref:Translation initiation factor IF-3 n=1 Tax=Candidatus Yanofskybacteria bacterium RIFCSPHIGHO2_01_FULL_41_53 TaxID=1802663 RepID=A0A1F8EM15_9BACT|nr:MAG: translation initiation factor IF-3 [Candidatus Yanofskybacteria bacterium RIFCSPHIGHO2_01_FULL_41_53]OGN12222.1 MAG: translation initiation factor IF-3 [Candidatus Yanofskybacteria bacterium RIFCSPHIGHO2_02_FULL_41_29]OGN23836.1 MAG: translation initiation factor IF-3 [Candidatus Yanofskybacteria bacterium RIFCSPLOWO2_01_FULL_41_67]OGN28572.1 MAG: translation initiation factor IF-3 [Candidatus Yanofskybacteria bacterium RIFCSPLOWO2_02_FULL_41_13]OGN35840.1 MAG: translation initiation fa
MQKSLRVNNQIRIPEVQVIDDRGNQLGILPIFEALRLAREKSLDLVEVSPQTKPPIAKIMDYGKYMYRKEKQEKGQIKQKDHETKTIRVGFKTGEHDLKFKSEQIDEFLKDGHPVKIELTLRGREKALAHLGRNKLDNFLKLISEPYAVQHPVSRSPFGWIIFIKKDKQLPKSR